MHFKSLYSVYCITNRINKKWNYSQEAPMKHNISVPTPRLRTGILSYRQNQRVNTRDSPLGTGGFSVNDSSRRWIGNATVACKETRVDSLLHNDHRHLRPVSHTTHTHTLVVNWKKARNKNLSSHIDLHTHAGRPFHNRVTLTSWLQG